MSARRNVFLGIDAGSRMLKAVLWDATHRTTIGSAAAPQAVDQRAAATALISGLLDRHSLAPQDVARTVATGYGRNLVESAHTTVTEITCHARGVHHLHPGTRSILEVGGQDSKVICLDRTGRVRDFEMNDRCAAGTGRFLEMVAARLDIPLARLGEVANQSRHPAVISSTCVVFAETEIVGLLAQGRPAPDVISGIQAAMAARLATMAGQRLETPVVFTGGVALVPGMREALEKSLGCCVQIAGLPMLTGALGAALAAEEQYATDTR